MLWFFVIIVLPVTFPLLAMLVLKLSPQIAPTASVLAQIKDGQLCWAAATLAFAGIYEIQFPQEGVLVDSDVRAWCVVVLALVAMGSAMIAALGAVSPVALQVPATTKWYKHFSSLVTSAVLTFIAAATYTVLHFLVAG